MKRRIKIFSLIMLFLFLSSAIVYADGLSVNQQVVSEKEIIVQPDAMVDSVIDYVATTYIYEKATGNYYMSSYDTYYKNLYFQNGYEFTCITNQVYTSEDLNYVTTTNIHRYHYYTW